MLLQLLFDDNCTIWLVDFLSAISVCPTKKPYSSSTVCFVRKNARTRPLYCLLSVEYRQNKAGWLPRSPRIGDKNMGKTRRENGRVSQVKWKLLSAAPNLEVSSELEETGVLINS